MLGVASPCRAQTESNEPPVAGPAEQSAQTVLWLAPTDPELGNRLKGQLIDTSWQLQERPAGAPFNGGDRATQLRAAFEGARLTQAAAVVWVREDSERMQVLVLDVAHSRLSVRDVPRQVGDSAEQSAAFETAALIVRATLASIESGMQVGDAVVEPEAPGPVADEPPAPSLVPATESEVQDGASVWARVGIQGHPDDGQPWLGPQLGVGLTFGQVRLGVLGHFLLPREQRADYVSAGVAEHADLELSRLGMAVSAEYDLQLSQQWAVFLGLQPGVTLLHRQTRRSSTLQPSPSESYVLPTLAFAGGLGGPKLFGVLTPELMVGMLLFMRVPKLSVGPAPEVALDQQLSRLEPWLGLGFRLP